MPANLRFVCWQLHTDLILPLRAPVTIVAGPNYSGKTGILDGIEFAFLGTGRLRGIDTKKDLARLSIQDDANGCRVDVEIGDLQLSRYMAEGGEQTVYIDGVGYKVTRGDAKIRELLGIEPERVRAALEADHILTGDEERRRWVFFRASGAVATVGEILGPISDTGIGEEASRKLADLVIKEGFRRGQDQAEAERLFRKRALGGEAFEPSAVFQPPWDESLDPIRLDEVKLEDFETRQLDLETRLAAAEAAAAEARGTILGKLEGAQEKLEGLRAGRGLLLEEKLKTVSLEGAERDGAIEMISRLETERVAIEEKIATLRGQRKAIAEGSIEKPDFCPAIPGRPACPMTETKLKKHRETVAKQVANCDELIGYEDQKREKILDERATWEERLDKATQRWRSATRLEELELEIREAEATETSLKAELEKTPEPAEDADEPADLRTRLAHLRLLITSKLGYDLAREAFEGDKANRATAEVERDQWDRAVQLLKPDGLPARLFEARRAELQGFIDELELDPRVRLRPDAALEMKVGDRWRVRAQLSESLRLRLSLAASHAVARASGAPLLIVDRFDHFDPVGRANVLDGLRRVAKFYAGGVLVLATLQRSDPQPTPFEDVATLILEGDRVRSIG